MANFNRIRKGDITWELGDFSVSDGPWPLKIPGPQVPFSSFFQLSHTKLAQNQSEQSEAVGPVAAPKTTEAQVMDTCTDLLAPPESSNVKLQSGAGSLISCLPSLATAMVAA